MITSCVCASSGTWFPHVLAFSNPPWIRRTGVPPPWLNTAYHIWISLTGARPLWSGIGRGGGEGRVFQAGVSIGSKVRKETISATMAATVAANRITRPSNGEERFTAWAMDSPPSRGAAPWRYAERVRKCRASAAHAFELLYSGCAYGRRRR